MPGNADMKAEGKEDPAEAVDKEYGLGTSNLKNITIKPFGWDEELLI